LKDELPEILKLVVLTQFKVLSQHFQDELRISSLQAKKQT